MATFTYVARTHDGFRKEGQIDAANRNEAVDILTKDELIVVKLTHKDLSFDFIEPFIQRFNLAITRLKNRIPLNTLVFFTRQLATMFSAGLTIEKSLHFLAVEEKHKKFRSILKKIEDNIKKGLLLSDALSRHPGVFSNLYVSLVRAGEVSGKLSATLDELAGYMEALEDTQRKVKSAMYYPVFIIMFLFVMLILIFTVIIPQFSSVYETLGADLPFYTVMMVNTGEWVQNNLFFLTFTSIVSLTGLWLLTLTDSGRLTRDRFLLRLPVFGNLLEQSILSKFCKTFGILVEAGVTILESFHLIKRVVDNRVFELAINSASKDIENGVNISRALKDTNVYPPILIQLMATGEETGEIDQLSLKAADYYTKQVNAIVDRLTSIIEPALIILVGGIVGLIVVVTYLPIFHFGSALAQ